MCEGRDLAPFQLRYLTNNTQLWRNRHEICKFYDVVWLMIHTAMNRQDLHQFPSRIEFYYSRAVAWQRGVSHCVKFILSCPIYDNYFHEFVANVLRDNMGMIIFDLWGCGGCYWPKTPYLDEHFGTLNQSSVHPTAPVMLTKDSIYEIIYASIKPPYLEF